MVEPVYNGTAPGTESHVMGPGNPVPPTPDLGPGRSFRFTRASRASSHPDAIVGGIETHPHAVTGIPCSGFVTFDVPGAPDDGRHRWRVVSWAPLTLDPSLQCRACGNHGHIRDGKWVPA